VGKLSACDEIVIIDLKKAKKMEVKEIFA